MERGKGYISIRLITVQSHNTANCCCSNLWAEATHEGQGQFQALSCILWRFCSLCERYHWRIGFHNAFEEDINVGKVSAKEKFQEDLKDTKIQHKLIGEKVWPVLFFQGRRDKIYIEYIHEPTVCLWCSVVPIRGSNCRSSRLQKMRKKIENYVEMFRYIYVNFISTKFCEMWMWQYAKSFILLLIDWSIETCSIY